MILVAVIGIAGFIHLIDWINKRIMKDKKKMDKQQCDEYEKKSYRL
ncbi:hypothetical protein ABE222_21295 [Bacillus tropicus]